MDNVCTGNAFIIYPNASEVIENKSCFASTTLPSNLLVQKIQIQILEIVVRNALILDHEI